MTSLRGRTRCCPDEPSGYRLVIAQRPGGGDRDDGGGDRLAAGVGGDRVQRPATQASPPAYSGVVGEDRHANDTTNRVVSVTTATSSGDAEQSTRIKRYLITMAIRTACFVLMVVVDGWLRWGLPRRCGFPALCCGRPGQRPSSTDPGHRDAGGAARGRRPLPAALSESVNRRSLTSVGRVARSRASRCRARRPWRPSRR